MVELLEAAPRVKPGTLIIFTNVPRDRDGDAFIGENLWFNMALRLAYPGTPVAGAYWRHDGTPADGKKPKMDADGNWEFDPRLPYKEEARTPSWWSRTRKPATRW